MRVLALFPTDRLREMGVFALVGILNTSIDFAILNVLIALTHHQRGGWLFAEDCIAFTCAVINSYFWNARVTFKQHQRRAPRHLLVFFAIALVGLLLNGVVVVVVGGLLSKTIAPLIALNGSKALATTVSLCWNYGAMRRWIFHPAEALGDIFQASSKLASSQELLGTVEASPRIVRPISFRSHAL